MHDMMTDTAFYRDDRVTLFQGDCLDVLRRLPSESVHCCVTSPPYFGLRDYGTASWEGGDIECDHKRESQGKSTWGEGSTGSSTLAGKPTNDNHNQEAHFRDVCGKCGAIRIDEQIGLEASPQEFIAKMVEVFEEVRRVLRSDGCLWLNLGDSYNGSGKGGNPEGSPHTKQKTNIGSLMDRPTRIESLKPKDLCGIPWRVAFALQEAGWWLRSDLPWVKRSAIPESVTDRPAKALEYVFLLTKAPKYFFDMQAIRQESTDFVPGDKTHKQTTAAENGDEKMRTKGGLVAYAQKLRDRSLPQNRNGITDHLDNTPAGGRNFRNSDLFFSSIKDPHGLISLEDELVGLDVNPSGFKEAHFATFPAKLVEPLIKASTSEKGVCAACGKQWARAVDVSYSDSPKGMVGNTNKTITDDRVMHSNRANDKRLNKHIETLGWQKSCKCETDEVVPATVLDPFAGAGTTMLVAKRLGRSAQGIELNPEYCQMIERRLSHWHKPAPPPEPKDAEVLPLFQTQPTEAVA